MKFFSKFFDYHEKEITRIGKLVKQINEQDDKMRSLSESDFPLITKKFQNDLQNGKNMDDLLVEAFALCREAASRVLSEKHYDEQLMAGIALHEGKIAEQKTGEGKTLSATTALYLNALTGKGVHLVTVNDYLAKRDAGWMGRVFDFLGLTTSVIVSDASFVFDKNFQNSKTDDFRLLHLRPCTRSEAYQADITYGINSEFGFDYLRDNMADSPQGLVQRDFHFAIIDEVDSVLIDEARTPHIISSPVEKDVSKYYTYANIVKKLQTNDYVIDEKTRSAHLTDEGISRIEQMLSVTNIYEKDFETIFHIEAALKAHTLFKNDRDYIVANDEVVIVDEFTGRLLEGRRFSEGIHQALEAKENVNIKQESKTLATISLQNYFRLYEKLAGMTGTAVTESEEFHKIYKLHVLKIPPHKTQLRVDQDDLIFKNERGKMNALANEIANVHASGRPILIGTTSIEKNELLGSMLSKKGIKHNLLNAKNHEKEAQIIAQSGIKGAVTVATNMAGRGVDIILGGQAPNRFLIDSDDKEAIAKYEKDRQAWKEAHDEVVALGGLYVIGTERHESRRIDNQLRGRSGRQGDPGQTKFFVSLEDDLMRIFGGEQVAKLMNFFSMSEDEPLTHPLVSKALSQAQIKVESFNFDSRKNLVDFDDVLTKQRDIFYSVRRKFLLASTVAEVDELVLRFFQKIIEGLIFKYQSNDDFDRNGFVNELEELLDSNQSDSFQTQSDFSPAEFAERIFADILSQNSQKIGEQNYTQVKKIVALQILDEYWTEHLTAIDDMRSAIGLRAHAQLDPLVEYKKEAYELFESLLANVRFNYIFRLMHLQLQAVTDLQASEKEMILSAPASTTINLSQTESTSTPPFPPTPKTSKKLGRNDPCWCGSGKKYKKCHYPN